MNLKSEKSVAPADKNHDESKVVAELRKQVADLKQEIGNLQEVLAAVCDKVGIEYED